MHFFPILADNEIHNLKFENDFDVLFTKTFFPTIFSILNDELDINLNADGSTVTIQAATHDLVYSYMEQKNESGPEEQILIPKNCPIPIRKSHHLQTSDQGSITVKVFLKSTELMELAEVCITAFKVNNWARIFPKN